MVDIEEHDRFNKFIVQNIVHLAENTKCDKKFLTIFLPDNFLDQTAIDRILDETGDYARSSAFYLQEIVKRGPKALPVIIKAMRITAQEESAKKLEKLGSEFLNKGETSKVGSDSIVKKTSSSSAASLLEEGRMRRGARDTAKTKACSHLEFTKYPITSTPAGYALVVNMIEFEDRPDHYRDGAHYDSDKLTELLEDFDYEVYSYENLGLLRMNEIVKAFIQKFHDAPVDSCIVSIMSHGDGDGNILTADRTKTCLSSIIDQFNNVNCPQLKDKPKIFFLQNCRGNTVDKGTFSVSFDGEPIPPPQGRLITLPTWTDMLICYSTLEGHYSFRDDAEGTWFIQLVCEVFRREAKKMDICKMLNLVAKEMRLKETEEGLKQICPYTNIGFIHEFYFRPRE